MNFNNMKVSVNYNTSGGVRYNSGELIRICNNVVQFVDAKTNKTVLVPLTNVVSIREE